MFQEKATDEEREREKGGQANEGISVTEIFFYNVAALSVNGQFTCAVYQ